MNGSVAYPLLAIAGILLSSVIWTKLLRRDGRIRDHRMELIYIAALCGAFIGAKLMYFLAEGWRVFYDPGISSPLAWNMLLTGKSITGALLGGYATVEIAKKALGYERATGDFFAVIAPLGLMLGRVGCYIQGCCPGVEMEHHWYTLVDSAGISRWPAVPVEFAFNLTFILYALVLYKRGMLEGQLFHVYLIAYGVFRFAHEFLRATPPLAGPVTGYQLAAVAILLLGVVRYRQRAKGVQPAPQPSTAP